jgi:hypothetical protein
MECPSELVSDIERAVASSLEGYFRRHHTFNRVLGSEVELTLRKTTKAFVDLALTQVDSPACYFALLYASL